MNFFEKHYEKLLLAVLLVVFVFSLVYLINLSKSVNNITEKDLQIKPGHPDYVKLEFSEEKYDVDGEMAKFDNWEESEIRDGAEASALVSDLLVPVVSGRCPHCKRFVPDYYFQTTNSCPLCQGELPTPTRDYSDLNASTGADADADGMPNAFELRNGLNPYNPYDGILDWDNDGFSNNFEYREKTSLRKPEEHPEYSLRLYAAEVEAIPLKAWLRSVNLQGSRDQWEIRIANSSSGTGSRRYIGDSLTIDRKQYKIVDAGIAEEQSGDDTVDVSWARIQSEDGESYTLVLNRPTPTKDSRAVIQDISNYSFKVEVQEGSTFRMGNNISGVEEFRVISIDQATGRIELLNIKTDPKNREVKTETKVAISKTIQIPERYRLGNTAYYQQRQSSSMMNRGGMQTGGVGAQRNR